METFIARMATAAGIKSRSQRKAATPWAPAAPASGNSPVAAALAHTKTSAARPGGRSKLPPPTSSTFNRSTTNSAPGNWAHSDNKASRCTNRHSVVADSAAEEAAAEEAAADE